MNSYTGYVKTEPDGDNNMHVRMLTCVYEWVMRVLCARRKTKTGLSVFSNLDHIENLQILQQDLYRGGVDCHSQHEPQHQHKQHAAPQPEAIQHRRVEAFFAVVKAVDRIVTLAAVTA